MTDIERKERCVALRREIANLAQALADKRAELMRHAIALGYTPPTSEELAVIGSNRLDRFD